MASISDYITVFIDRIPGLQDKGMALSNALHDVVRSSPKVRDIVDVLHGKQAGHPIHPILASVTLGAWVLGSAFDLASTLGRSKSAQSTADDLIGVGTVLAVPTMLTGTADYSGLPQDAIKVGTLHAAANVVGIALYGLSIASRKFGARGLGIGLSLAGMGVMAASGYLGGDLAYRLQVGVNRNSPPDDEDKPRWRQVLTSDELAVGETKRVMLEDKAVLLFRDDDGVFAISNVCSHAAGPLNEGTFDGACVECPWHHSVFDMRTGDVVHGPAVFSQPVYPVRMRAGHIEVFTKPDPVGRAREQFDELLALPETRQSESK